MYESAWCACVCIGVVLIVVVANVCVCVSWCCLSVVNCCCGQCVCVSMAVRICDSFALACTSSMVNLYAHSANFVLNRWSGYALALKCQSGRECTAKNYLENTCVRTAHGVTLHTN